MEPFFVDNVDVQNALFDVLRKYDVVAFGDRQLFPSYWKTGVQPKILYFICDTANRIKALHATKKRQQALASGVINEIPKEVPKDAVVVVEDGKVKSKVRRGLSLYLLC